MKSSNVVVVALASGWIAACGQEPAPKVEAKVDSKVEAPAPPPLPKEVPITSRSAEAVAAFKQARDLVEGSRPTEGEEILRKALAMDPDFAQAHTLLSTMIPAKDAKEHIEKARTLIASLPPGERELVEGDIATFDGDDAKSVAARKKLAEMFPDDWRPHGMLGMRAFNEEKWDDAARELKRAVELNPNAGPVWNMLGYVNMATHKNDDAVVALQKFAEVAPNDPNARDSLGDALMKAGKHAEAEASFQKALEIDPKFSLAWTGVALSRANRGDWKGALDAMQKSVDAEPKAENKPRQMIEVAWWQLAAGKAADARKTLAAAQKAAEEQKLDGPRAFMSLQEAAMALEAGKPKDALKAIDDGAARAETAAMSGDGKLTFKAWSQGLKARAHADLGAKDDATKAAAEVEAIAKAQLATPWWENAIHEARADAARAAKDAPGALAEYAQCTQIAATCLARGIDAAAKAGDKAMGETLKARLGESAGRDGMLVYARAHTKLIPAK